MNKRNKQKKRREEGKKEGGKKERNKERKKVNHIFTFTANDSPQILHLIHNFDCIRGKEFTLVNL